MYSQYEEEKYILEYFKNRKGRLLDIGAYHPETFSNSRQLIINGWEAVLVEASPECCKNIADFYENNVKVRVMNIAIAGYDGELTFYNSEGAVATAIKSHYEAWKDKQLDYRIIKIPCVSWNTFYAYISTVFPGRTYEFINIDTEGLDWNILSQINLEETKTEMVCVEISHNSQQIVDYLLDKGFNKMLYYNQANIIVVKEEVSG